MIRLAEAAEGRKNWPFYVVLSFFLHASIIGALVFVPEQSVKRFTSAMDFSVEEEKEEAKPPPVKEEEEKKEEEAKPVIKKMPKKVQEKAPEPPPPPPPEVKKFEMDKDSFADGGTFGVNVDIGESRIGSAAGTAKEGGKTSSAPVVEFEPPPPPKPKEPKKLALKEKPKVVEEVTIPYPAEARRLEIEGDVMLEVHISSKGSVVKVRILKDPGGGLGK
ncbi:MAG: TonB family protein, partial [Pseudomonadota bacterium]